MKCFLRYLLLCVFLAACQMPNGSSEVVETAVPFTATSTPSPIPVTIEVTREVLPPQPSATPAACTPLTSGMRLEIVPQSETAFTFSLAGFPPGDSLIFQLTAETAAEGAQIESMPVAAVSPDGTFISDSFNLGHFDAFKMWQGKVIDSTGAACFDITLPLPSDPIVYVGAEPVPTAALPLSLTGHLWQLVAAGGEAADMFLPDPPAWLRFTDDPDTNSERGFSFSGYSGCNTLFGSYVVSDETLVMSVGMTQKGCRSGFAEFETFMVDILRSEPTFIITPEGQDLFLTLQMPDTESGRLVFRSVNDS